MKICVIGDTHNRHKQLLSLPEADMIVHVGDVSGRGYHHEIRNFFDWFQKIPYKYKVMIAGNHDFFFESFANLSPALQHISGDIPPGITYLNDSGAEIEGIKIWGSPVSPTFFNWAFMRNRGEQIAKHWEMIPPGQDIVITHGPPHKILDACPDHVGCEELAKYVKKLKPKFHFFGHVHEGYGIVKKGKTTYVNASVLDGSYRMVNHPVVIEI